MSPNWINPSCHQHTALPSKRGSFSFWNAVLCSGLRWKIPELWQGVIQTWDTGAAPTSSVGWAVVDILVTTPLLLQWRQSCVQSWQSSRVSQSCPVSSIRWSLTPLTTRQSSTLSTMLSQSRTRLTRATPPTTLHHPSQHHHSSVILPSRGKSLQAVIFRYINLTDVQYRWLIAAKIL